MSELRAPRRPLTWLAVIIGAIGTRQRAQVRGGGTVVLHEGTPDELELTWWIGADDRWHVLETEVTARQTLVRDLPIVTTSARVPSGDVVTNTFVAVQGPRELVVMDLDNRSKVPFAVALVVRGRAANDVTLDGSTVRVGGVALVHLPRVPQRAATAPTNDVLLSVVTTGAATDRFAPLSGPSASAFLFPVTHGTSLRAAVLLGASNPLALAAAPVLSALPSVHDVANGWDTQLGRAPQIRVPLAPGSYRTTIAALLLAAEPAVSESSTRDRVLLAAALDRVGFHAEAGALLEHLPDRQGRRGSFDDDVATTAHVIDAVSRHAAFGHDAVFAETFAPVIAGALEYLLKQAKRDPSAAPWLASASLAPTLFQVARDSGAAAQVSKRVPRGLTLPTLLPEALPATSPGGVFVPEDPVRLYQTICAHIDALGNCRWKDVDILAGMSADSLGQPVEIRSLPTPFGRLSYALRWHGERPALLWECVPIHDDQNADALRLTSAGFEGWVGTGAKGESLLPAFV